MKLKFEERYSDEEEIKRYIAEYNKGVSPENEVRYYSYFDSVAKKRFYLVCPKEFFHAWRNMLSEEHRKIRESKSCHVESARYKNTHKLCRHYKKGCHFKENCPYINQIRYAANGETVYPGDEVNKGGYLSLDQAFEDYELEVEDSEDKKNNSLISDDVFADRVEENELVTALYEAKDTLSAEDKLIIELFMADKKDREIAEVLHKPKATITSRRNRLFEILREKLKNF